MRREFRDLTVKEAICDLEKIFDLSKSKDDYQKYYNVPFNHLPYAMIEEMTINIVDFIVGYWFVEMSRFGEDGVAFYKEECRKNGIQWIDYRKYCYCDPLFTDFAKNHLEEITIAYLIFDASVLKNADNKNYFKKYRVEGPKKKIGPFTVKSDTIESTFLDDLKVSVASAVNEYYCYGHHLFDNDDDWEKAKENTLKIINNAINQSDGQEGIVII